MNSKKNIKRLVMILLLATVFLPIIVSAATSTGISGLSVAKYKLEGAENKAWTNLTISSNSRTNSQDIVVTKTGTTVVTLYAEDRAGNQAFDIKMVTLVGENQVAPVKKIEYKLTGDTEKEWTIYNDPFTITNEGVTHLEARITDEAGNVTTVKESISIDKTKPVNTEAVITLD